MYANDVSMSGYVIDDILIKFVTPTDRLSKESRSCLPLLSNLATIESRNITNPYMPVTACMLEADLNVSLLIPRRGFRTQCLHRARS